MLFASFSCLSAPATISSPVLSTATSVLLLLGEEKYSIFLPLRIMLAVGFRDLPHLFFLKIPSFYEEQILDSLTVWAVSELLTQALTTGALHILL